jgi:UDP-N-acetyl-D-galactosamine dehydrogenase
VGGHCIGVDPYYLTHKAEEIGHRPEIILAGRRINDGMGAFVAGQMVKAMLRRRLPVDGARVLILGLAFKENCPDLRNTGVVDVIAELRDYGVAVDVHDPWVDPEAARAEFGLAPVQTPQAGLYDGVMLCVAHDSFRDLGADGIRAFGKPGHVLYDLKHVLPAEAADIRL